MAASPLAAALLGGQAGGFPGAAFADPAVAQATPDLQLAQALMQGGLSTAPASPMQALARVAQTAAGGYLQRGAISDLARAYAHTADNAAATLPEGHPLRMALQSADPLVRMQGLQAYQKALTLMSEPSNLGPGQQRFVGNQPYAENTNPQSEPGKVTLDAERAAARARGGAGTGMGSVIGGGTGPGAGAEPASRAPATSVPGNPLQPAINYKAAEAGATKTAEKQAEANVDYGPMMAPSPVTQGPGGTEPVPVNHTDPRTSLTHQTLIPPVKEQTLPGSPAEAKEAAPAWQKTETGFTSGLAAGQDAEQRLKGIADAFKTIKTGWGTEQKAQVNAMLKSVGLPELLPNASPAAAEQALHENYVQTLKRLQSAVAGTGGRFTQMEFKLLSENAEHPNLQPEANLRMLSEDLAQIRQGNAMARDWGIAKSQYGWKNPQAFTEAWLRHNPIENYTADARKEIGPLKGMEGQEGAGGAGGKSAAAPPVPGARQAPDGHWYVADPARPGKYLMVQQ